MRIFFKIIFLLFDILLMYISFVLSWKIRFYNDFNIIKTNYNDYIWIFYLSVLTWIFLTYALNLLHVPRTLQRNRSSFWYFAIYPHLILIPILFIGIIYLNYDDISRLFLSLFLFTQLLFLAFSKAIRSIFSIKMRLAGVDLIGLGVISDSKNIEKYINWFKSNDKTGFYFSNLNNNKIHIQNFEDAFNLLHDLKSGDYLILEKSFLSKDDSIRLKEIAENKGIHIYRIISDDRLNFLKEMKVKGIVSIGPLNLIKIRKTIVKNSINIINKRIFDFLFSLSFIILVYWWVYIIVLIIVKFQSKGPILFKQLRIGLDGEKFMCYKFRTMHIDETNSKVLTQVGDTRIFSFGQFMRKSNIDEFPQFINVFKGDMSIVGPRPHMVSEDKDLSNKIDKYRIRRWVKPGITGYAAINGFRGGTNSLQLMQKRIDFDIKYIENWSLYLDVKICYKTFIEMLLFKSKGH